MFYDITVGVSDTRLILLFTDGAILVDTLAVQCVFNFKGAIKVLWVARTESWDRVEIIERVFFFLAVLVEGRIGHIDVALCIVLSIAKSISIAWSANAHIILHILRVARVLI